MKVLLLADGRSLHAARYQTELKRRGVEVIFASLENGPTVDIHLHLLAGIRGLNYLLAARKIRHLIERERPDIVDAHSASGYGYTTAMTGVAERIPVLLHCLGSDVLISAKKSTYHRMRVGTALDKSSLVIVDSQYLEQQARQMAPAMRAEVIYWGSEDAVFDLYDARQTSPEFNRAMPVYILIPRPHERIYNNEFVIRALKGLINGGKIVLTFPDWGTHRREFDTAVKRECPSVAIPLYSRLPRMDYIRFLGGFDVYLSAAQSDSSPASLIEAMAAGLVPIVADIPGVRELVGPDTALLFKPGEERSVREAMAKLLSGQVDVEKLRTANHKLANARGRFSENIDRTIAIMKQLIGHER